MGGGGGDGGYQARQDAIDRDKAAARQRLNLLFGVAPTSSATTSGGAALVPGAVVDALTGGGVSGSGDAAEAAKNKAALDTLYSKVRSDAYAAGKTRLDEQRGTAGRNLKFELFARGLNGGSEDVNQNALLGRTYTQGITDLGAKADDVATQLKSDDEATRLGLLQSIDNGMDQQSAISSAIGQMKNSADRAASAATSTNLGDAFANAGLLYQDAQYAKGKASAAAQMAAKYPSLFGGSTKAAASGSTSFSG